MKSIFCFIFLSFVLAGCMNVRKHSGEISITLRNAPGGSISYRPYLWGLPAEYISADTATGQTEFKQSVCGPDVYTLWLRGESLVLYLEPGDQIIVERGKQGGYLFGGDKEVVARNLLLRDLRHEYDRLQRYRKGLHARRQRGTVNTQKEVTLEEVEQKCNGLIHDFKSAGVGHTPAFERFIELDYKYFCISQRIDMPPYLVKTYHDFTPEDLKLLESCREDACCNEVTLSLYYRQVACAYMDYLRIHDPEKKMGDGREFLENEYSLGEYFPGGEVRTAMLRELALDRIGYDFQGDSCYLSVVKRLPEKWGNSLVRNYSQKATVAKGGRKIEEASLFPDIKGENVDGKIVSLKDFKGKWVLIDCWATWCGPCNFEISYLKQLEHALEGENIVFLGVSVDAEKDKEKWKEFVAEKELDGIQILCVDKSSIYKELGINGIPHFALIDPSGKLFMNKVPKPSTGVTHHLLEAYVK